MTSVTKLENKFKSQRNVAYQKKYVPGLAGAVRRNNHNEALRHVRTKEFNDLADSAYGLNRGYDIADIDGSRIMYVSGSRNTVDWVFNVLDSKLPVKHQFVSNKTANKLHNIAVRNGVDVVVGHSRGGALVAKMPGGKYQKLGLDAAMILPGRKQTRMMNLAQKQPLDRIIDKGLPRWIKYNPFTPGLASMQPSRRGFNTRYYKAGKHPYLKSGDYRWHYISRQDYGYKKSFREYDG